MADRQREFLMAANHYRAGRITIDDFKKKVLAATAVQGEVAVVFDPKGDSKSVENTLAELKTAGAKVVKFEVRDGELPEAETIEKKLKSAGAVVVIGSTDLASVAVIAQAVDGTVIVVPDEQCDASDLASVAVELPPGVAMVGKGQFASAAKMAARVARP